MKDFFNSLDWMSFDLAGLVRDFIHAAIFAFVMFCPFIAYFMIYGG